MGSSLVANLLANSLGKIAQKLLHHLFLRGALFDDEFGVLLSVLLLFGLLLGHNALNGFEEARAELLLLKHLGDRSKGNGLGYDGGGGHC